MTHKSIAQQIRSISNLLVGGLLVLASVALCATLLIRSIFTEYRATSRSTLEATAIFEDLFEARIAALKWRDNFGEEALQEFARNVEEITQLEKSLIQSNLPKAFSDAVGRLIVDIAQYKENFENSVRGHAQFVASDAEVSTLGKQTREQITELMDIAFEVDDPSAIYNAGRAQESLLLGRLYVERYRNSENNEYLNTATSHLNNAKQFLQSLLNVLDNPRQIELANVASKGLSDYLDKTGLLAESVEQRIFSRQAMDALGPKMIADIELALDQIVDRQNTLGPRGQSFALYTVVFIALSASIIVIFGWYFSRRTSSSIVLEIEQSVATMSRIAEGDLEVEVFSTENENEIGRMARALEVFKANGKAAIENAAREKEAEQGRLEAEAVLRQERQEQELQAREDAETARQEMIASLSASLGVVVLAASKGDFSKRVDAAFSDEELSGLAAAVNTLVDSVDQGLTAAGAALEKVANGDLTDRMGGSFQGAFAQLQSNINDMIGALQSLIDDIAESGESLASSSSELRDTSDVLSKQAEQNAASLEETSAALEQLSASIKQVSGNVSDANENARVVSETAQSSGEVAVAASSAMSRIADASAEIKNVVTVINDISFQINLLALNAGVEAARAGDAGRGFSVVASEVRQLAQRASEAAKEIDSVIARSDSAVSEGVAKVADAKSSLAIISKSVLGISSRIAEVSNAISEQVHGIAEINSAVSQIDQNTQKQAASFEEVTAASSLLSNEAEALKKSTSRFVTATQRKVVALRTKSAKELAETPRQLVAAGGGNAQVSDWDEF